MTPLPLLLLGALIVRKSPSEIGVRLLLLPKGSSVAASYDF
jgi:hypothetical protein